VNGTKVREAFLQEGDIISGGNTKIHVSVKGTRTSGHDADASTVIRPQLAPDTLPPSTVSLTVNRATPEFPGYEFLEELGRGTMGVVYRARQKAKGRTVAIKMIVPRPIESDEPVQLFTREASVMRQLKHRHIVRCHEFCFSGGQFFLVMECVPTVPLASVLDGKSESSRIRIPCAIACQVLDALEYAHGLSIVHRDIKPENILLVRKGRKLNAKLTDFGLAKNYENAGFSELTRTGHIRGTVAYMPPEQIVDCRYARPSADIYAVGATLYEFLTGELPFDFGSRNKLRVVLEDEPIPIRDRCPALPSALAEMVHRALSKDPNERFRSADAMRRELQSFLVRRRNCDRS
jgi:serine/threonine protein kinase